MRPPEGSRSPARASPQRPFRGATGRSAAAGEEASGAPAAAAAPPAEARQRWRLIFRIAAADAPGGSTQREELQAWESALRATGLPLAGLDGPRGRPRIQLGAALSSATAGERELLDLWLTERVTLDTVAEALRNHAPPGHQLVDLHDVWTGAPALPAQVVAADYRIRLGSDAPDAAAVDAAARRLLARESIPRERPKGSGPHRYDLRPLLADISLVDVGPPVVLRIRSRFDPHLGAGRPDEVLGALGDLLGRPCPAAELVRERLILAGEE